MAELNRCNKCKVLDVTTCPLRDHAWSMFNWEGLSSCAMGDAIDKLLIAIRVDGRFISTMDGKRPDVEE